MRDTLDRDGVPIAWESHGDGTPPILLMPAWAIVHSRMWKLQVPYLARHHRVVTFDPRGNGASGRPARSEDYTDDRYAGDALAVLDAAGVDAALVVGLSAGALGAESYALWIGDEAWEVDHHLHENPGDKRAPFVWLTDFVGWLPLPEHGEREVDLAADLNAEMIEHVEGPRAVRDLALFVGDPELRRAVPDARMLVVCGPRIDPSVLPAAAGLEVRGYDPELPACDVALTHGGLSTGMERVAAGTPFVSVPLRRHFEQVRHARHRLERHGHARSLDAAEATPERLAAELAAALRAPPDYVPVRDGGAARAAELIAALL